MFGEYSCGMVSSRSVAHLAKGIALCTEGAGGLLSPFIIGETYIVLGETYIKCCL